MLLLHLNMLELLVVLPLDLNSSVMPIKTSFGRFLFLRNQPEFMQKYLKIKTIKTHKESAILIFGHILYLISSINFWIIEGNWHDQQRIMQIFLFSFISVTALIFTFSSSSDSQSSFYKKKDVIIFLAFSLSGLLSVFFSKYWGNALLEWALVCIAIMSAAYIAKVRVVANDSFDRWAVTAINFTFLFYLVGLIARFLAVIGGQPIIVGNLLDGFSNIRFFGQYLTFTLPFLALMIFNAKSLIDSFAGFCALGLGWMVCIASGTRGSWLALGFATIIVFFLNRKPARLWVKYQVFGCVSGLLAYLLFFFYLPSLFSVETTLQNRLSNITTLSLREVIWERALVVIMDSPVLGAGPMHFAAYNNGVGAHPHNSLLQIAAEWGLPAMSLVLVVAIYALSKWVPSIGKNEEVSFHSMVDIALFAAVVAAMVQSLVDGVIVMPYSQVLLIFIGGWAWGKYRSDNPVAGENNFYVGKKPVFVLVFLVVGMLFYCVPQIGQLVEREEAFKLKHQTSHFHPRFWRQGWIDQ